MSDEAMWVLARATGVVALAATTLVVVLGLASRARARTSAVLVAVHRSTSLLVVVLVALHLGGLLLDDQAGIALTDLVVPFTTSYRPFWTGLGTLALELLVVLVVTSLLRARLGLRAWRGVHLLAHAMWPIALAHGLGTGSDATTWWFRTLALVSIAAVAAAAALRLRAPRTADAVAPAPPGAPPRSLPGLPPVPAPPSPAPRALQEQR